MKRQASEEVPEMFERLAALRTNVEAAMVVTGAVERTIGPKGLDVLLMDDAGEAIVTNDGATILANMDIHHPVARMMIKMAQAQEAEVGDGTTTATILAGALIKAGGEQVERGVPLNHVLDGMELAWSWALAELERRAQRLSGLDDTRLRQTALVSARGQEEIAQLAVEAAQAVGEENLLDRQIDCKEWVAASTFGRSEVIKGVVIERPRLHRETPPVIEGAHLLILDDALAPREVGDEALSSEAGFREYLTAREEFRRNLEKLRDAGVNCILLNRSLADMGDDMLYDFGIMVVEYVPHRQLEEVARYTGGRLVNRCVLERSAESIAALLGKAHKVVADDASGSIKIVDGAGRPVVTVVVHAATEDVLEERLRITKDAVAAVQSAVRGGVVAGGGAVELALARYLKTREAEIPGLKRCGLDCCVSALQKPMAQIVANAGFSPLEKIELAARKQAETGIDSLGIDCETGEVADMAERGIWDSYLVKYHAMRAAWEIAKGVLRIDLIIRKRPAATR